MYSSKGGEDLLNGCHDDRSQKGKASTHRFHLMNEVDQARYIKKKIVQSGDGEFKGTYLKRKQRKRREKAAVKKGNTD